MRLDKLTTKFQEALSDAQTLALGHDNAYIEPVHLLVAMLRQDDGPRALLEYGSPHVPMQGYLAQSWLLAPMMKFGGGTNEIQRDIVAQRGLGLPRG